MNRISPLYPSLNIVKRREEGETTTNRRCDFKKSHKQSPADRLFATYDKYLAKLKDHMHHTKKMVYRKCWSGEVYLELPRMPLSKRQKWWLRRLAIAAIRLDEDRYDEHCEKRRFTDDRYLLEDIPPAGPGLAKAVKAGTLKRRKKKN